MKVQADSSHDIIVPARLALVISLSPCASTPSWKDVVFRSLAVYLLCIWGVLLIMFVSRACLMLDQLAVGMVGPGSGYFRGQRLIPS